MQISEKLEDISVCIYYIQDHISEAKHIYESQTWGHSCLGLLIMSSPWMLKTYHSTITTLKNTMKMNCLNIFSK